jgi:hypothetical protein
MTRDKNESFCHLRIISVFSVPFHKQVITSTVFAQVRRDFSLLKILECETLQSLQA